MLYILFSNLLNSLSLSSSDSKNQNTGSLTVVNLIDGISVDIPLLVIYALSKLITASKFIGKFFKFCLEKGEKGGKKLQAKAGRGLFFALLLFVGIPLPGTGAWTGTLAASMLDMDFKSSVIAVMLGVILAGIIMGLASMGLFGGLSAIFAPK